MRLPSLLVLLSVATGCAQSFPDQDTPATRELRAFGESTWAEHAVRAPADYTLALLPADELAELCEADHDVGGCSYPEAGAILLDESLSPEQLRVGIVHELGHFLRHQHGGAHGHLACDERGHGADAMCPRADSAAVTPRDIRFALGR